MRTKDRLVLILLVSSLALTLAFVRYGGVPAVRALPTIYQGNLVLTGNNVTTITGTFNINGSIMVENNATLILKNAVLNFTQTSDRQYNMTFQNPTNGNPRLIVENATLKSAHTFYIYSYGNSSCVANKLHVWPIGATGVWWYSYDSSTISIANSTVYMVASYSNALFNAYNSTMRYLSAFDSASANASSTYITDTLTSFSSGNVVMSNSTTYSINTRYEALVQLENSTCSSYTFYNASRVVVSWYLGVKVVDSHGTAVGSANVTAGNSTAPVVESKLTDANGLTRLTLMQKMINATGSYPVGNYTVTAKYGEYIGQEFVNMTGDQSITISLPFTVPEFPSVLVLPAFIAATLIAVAAFKRKTRLPAV